MEMPNNLVVSDGKRTLIYPVKRLMIRRMLSGFFMLAPIWILLFPVMLFAHLYAILAETRRSQPLLALSPLGLEFYYDGTRIGPLQWREVGELSPKICMFGFQDVQVPLQNVTRLRERADGKWTLFWLAYIFTMRHTLGLNLLRLKIPLDCLPMSPDEFLALTEQYRLSAFIPAQAKADETVWPPPPASR